MSARTARRFRRWLRAALAAVSVAFTAAYIVIAHLANGVPSTPAYRGWIALIEPDTALHQIRLELAASVPGARGPQPRVIIRVVACGSSPFRGQLLLGGAARLLDPVVSDQPGLTTPSPVTAVAELGPVLGVSTDGQLLLPDTERILLTIAKVVPCLPASAGQPTAAVGSPVEVAGRLREPVQRELRMLRAHGPHESQSWPLVGRIPEVPTNQLGIYTFPDLDGAWVRPPQLRVVVDVGSLTNRAQVESSRPSPTSTDRLLWDSAEPLTPVARIVNLDAEGQWQQALVAAGIGLGVGTSVLATLLLELATSGRGATAETAAEAEQRVSPAPAEGSTTVANRDAARTVVPAAAAVGVIWLVARALRHRRRE